MKKAWCSKTNKKNGKRFNNGDYEFRQFIILLNLANQAIVLLLGF